MRKNMCAAAAVVMLINAFCLTSCSPGKVTSKPDPSDTSRTTVTAAASETTTETSAEETTEATTETSETSIQTLVTPPDKGCQIAFPTGDVYNYDMDLKFDPDNKTVGGHVVFEYFNDSEDTWKKLCMRDYPSLFAEDGSHGKNTDGGITEIENIEDDKCGKLKYKRDKEDVSVLWIDLSEPLKPGEKRVLSYDFTAKVPAVADRFGYYKDIYNITNFYPILAEYRDGAWSHETFSDAGECFYSEISNYKVKLDVPSGYIVASSGEETDSSEKDGILTYNFEAPFVRDFVFCAGDKLKKEQKQLGDVMVNVYYNEADKPDIDVDKLVEKTYKTADISLTTYNSEFGKYPYDELDILYATIAAGGMEYPNLVIIDNSEAETLADDDHVVHLEMDICHEIAHQWFMNIVGSDSGREPWLDETLASYAEILYLQESGQEENSHITWVSRERFDLSAADESKPDSMPHGMFETDTDFIDLAIDEYKDDFNYINNIYGLGKAFMYQTEQLIGKEELHAVIRAYVQANAFKNADTEDFFEVFYKYLGHDNDKVENMIDMMFSTLD